MSYSQAIKRIADALREESKSLDLSHLRLTAIPPEIGKLSGLRLLLLTSTEVSDLSPLRALGGLRKLVCRGKDWQNISQLSDLSRLKGMKLI